MDSYNICMTELTSQSYDKCHPGNRTSASSSPMDSIVDIISACLKTGPSELETSTKQSDGANPRISI